MGDSNDEINNPDHDEMDSPPKQPFSRDDISLGDEPETEVPIYDSDENIEETDTEGSDTLLSGDLRKRLKDRLRKRFNEEDLSYFEDDDEDGLARESDSSEGVGDVIDSVNEDWSDSPETREAGEDFDRDRSGETPNDDAMPISDKCAVLMFWLVFFLVSWQSGFSVMDSAVEMLLKFLSRYLWLLGTLDENGIVAGIAKRLPNTLYKLRKHLGLLGDDDFIKYVVCPKCKTLYDYKDCIQNRCGRQVSARCKFVPWTRHPHRSRRGKRTPCRHLTYLERHCRFNQT